MASPRICSEHPQQCAELRILSLNVWGIPVSRLSPSKFYICLLVLEVVSIFVVGGDDGAVIKDEQVLAV